VLNAEEKIRAAFSEFDTNGDGSISLEELEAYFLSVFLPHRQEDPKLEQLAKHTAQHAFTEADLNGDGKLQFDEFKRWFTGRN
jgi:Ca2+-binding EF-hand superfamily protein